MKKNTILIAALAAAFLATFSCAKVEPATPAEETEILNDGNFMVTFQCTMPEAKSEEAPESAAKTKTAFNGNTIRWTAGDKIGYYQYATVSGNKTLKNTTWTVDKNRDNLPQYTISSFNVPDENTEAYYFSVYPYNNYQGYTTSNDIPLPRITLPSTQHPSSTSFDSNSDILISNLVRELERNAEGKYSVLLQYTRPSAIAKMKITNLSSAAGIASIKFSAKKGTNDVVLAGSHYYDLENGVKSTLSGISCRNETEITLDYSTLESPVSAVNEMTAYFCCYPFELVARDGFKVVVTTTAGEVFTKEVTIPEGRTLAFKSGEGSKFSVDMSSAEEEMGCDWITVKQKPSSDMSGGNSTAYFSVKSTSTTITAISYRIVEKSAYESAISEKNLESLLNEGTNSSSQSSINSINSGKELNYGAIENLTPKSDYYVLIKVIDTENGTVIISKRLRTEAFGFMTGTTSSNTAGQFAHKFWGTDIVSIEYICTESSNITGDINNSNCRIYFDSQTHKNVSESTISKINNNGASGYGYLNTTYNLSSGTECIEMVLATFNDSTTKFCWKTQTSK